MQLERFSSILLTLSSAVSQPLCLLEATTATRTVAKKGYTCHVVTSNAQRILTCLSSPSLSPLQFGLPTCHPPRLLSLKNLRQCCSVSKKGANALLKVRPMTLVDDCVVSLVSPSTGHWYPRLASPNQAKKETTNIVLLV